jgi:hypothetical protein
MKYNLLGTTMNYFIENSILDIPDYVKIDVDGIEHLILQGGDKFLNNEKIKSLSIECLYAAIIPFLTDSAFPRLNSFFRIKILLSGICDFIIDMESSVDASSTIIIFEKSNFPIL